VTVNIVTVAMIVTGSGASPFSRVIARIWRTLSGVTSFSRPRPLRVSGSGGAGGRALASGFRCQRPDNYVAAAAFAAASADLAS
jgi:hypothetical protein